MGQITLLDKKLPRGSLVGIDTNIFIYHFSGHSKFGDISTDILESIEEKKVLGVTSVITVIEILYRTQEKSAEKVGLSYQETLSGMKNLSLHFVDLDVAQKAAEFRWKYRLHTPDAIQLATAVVSGCNVFITNDVRFSKVKEIPVLLLSDFVSSKPRKTKT